MNYFIMFFALICSLTVNSDEDTQASVDPKPVIKQANDTLSVLVSDCREKGIDEEGLKEKERLRGVIVCALNKVHPAPPPAKFRLRHLDFFDDRMVQNMGFYEIGSDVERSHLIAQMLHETATVEATTGGIRKTSTAANTPDSVKCEDYLSGIEGDNDHLANSGHSYKDKFRGRGIIQLTHCYNYLGFFYHRAAIKSGKPELATQHRTLFHYYKDDGTKVELRDSNIFCTDEDLKGMQKQFEKEGLKLKPDELITDFKDTMNKLSVPCAGSDYTFDGLTSEQFLVDSSFLYWLKCQNKKGLDVSNDSEEMVAKVSGCVHGAASTYKKNYKSWKCPKTKNGFNGFAFSNSIHSAWCSRKLYFNALNSCFKSSNSAAPTKSKRPMARPKNLGQQE